MHNGSSSVMQRTSNDAPAGVTTAFHSTGYVASLMAEQGLPAHGHGIGETFTVGRQKPDHRRSGAR